MKAEAVAYALLVPAPIIFAVRALMAVLGGAEMPGVALAIVGILSGAGMLLLLIALRKEKRLAPALLAVTVALSGHYIVNRFVDADLGGAMVYLGTAMAAGLHRPKALIPGLVAALGALLRGAGDGKLGNGILAVGALGLAGFLIVVVRDTSFRQECP